MVNQAIGIDAKLEESVAEEVLAFLGEHEDSETAITASNISILAAMGDVINNLDSPTNYTIWSENACCPNIEFIENFDGWNDTSDIIPYREMVGDEMAFIKLAHPDWSDLRIRLSAEYNLLSGGVHTLLDIGGLVEGLGAPFDAINGVFMR
ncbi:MAG: hypothetical protein C7N36_04095 [Bacteroidetes bacterium]|nr:MAG: hypothetical protein C7N36_04095 [Bacteroidota bacterium]